MGLKDRRHMEQTKMKQHFGNALYEDWIQDSPATRAALHILRAAHASRLKDHSLDYGHGRVFEVIYAAAYHLRQGALI